MPLRAYTRPRSSLNGEKIENRPPEGLEAVNISGPWCVLLHGNEISVRAPQTMGEMGVDHRSNHEEPMDEQDLTDQMLQWARDRMATERAAPASPRSVR